MTPARYFPVAAERDLPYRHVFHARLFDQELAIWRADDDQINIWDNRCRHRGVRLSIGQNMGRDLRCQYHGWRYASGDGACTTVPAHPAGPVPEALCARRFPVARAGGLIWTSLGDGAPLPDLAGGALLPDLAGDVPLPDLAVGALVLRALPIMAESGRVMDAIAAWPGATRLDPFTLQVDGERRLMAQPAGPGQMVLHALHLGPAGDAMALRRAVNHRLEDLRRQIEGDR